MTKPKIEDFIPPGWYASMDKDGSVLVSKDRCIRRQYFFYSEGFKYTRFAPEHAAMFDLSIFGDDWGKSLWQKPPENQNERKDMFRYKCEVLRVIDGDTVDLNVDLGFDVWTRQRIRLFGINSPEMKGESREDGLKARLFLESVLHDREITLETVMVRNKESRGKYGRFLGTLYVDGFSVNQKMIDHGYAVPVMFSIN